MVHSLRRVGDLYEDNEQPPFRLEAMNVKRTQRRNAPRDREAGRVDKNNDQDSETAEPKQIIAWASTVCTLPLYPGDNFETHHERMKRAIHYIVANPAPDKSNADLGVNGEIMVASAGQLKLIFGFLFNNVFGKEGLKYANTLIHDIQSLTDDKWNAMKRKQTLGDLSHNVAMPPALYDLYQGMLLDMSLHRHGSNAIHKLQMAMASMNIYSALSSLLKTVSDATKGNGAQAELKAWIIERKSVEDAGWTEPEQHEPKLWTHAAVEVLWGLIYPEQEFDSKKWGRLVRKGSAAAHLWGILSGFGTQDDLRVNGIFALLPTTAFNQA